MLKFLGPVGWFIELFFKGPLGRILDSIDKHGTDQVQKDQMKADVIRSYTAAQAQIATGPGWWIPLFFVAPVAFHFGSVCLYSVFWCKDCAYPQAWTIASLPGNMAGWEGSIILSYFVGAIGRDIMARIK